MLSLPPEIDRLLPTDEGKIALEALRDWYTELETLAGIQTELSALEAVDAELLVLAGIQTELSALEAVDAELLVLAGIQTELSALEAVDAELLVLAGIQTELSALEAVDAELLALAGGAGSFTSLTMNDNSITNVADIALDSITADNGIGPVLIYDNLLLPDGIQLILGTGSDGAIYASSDNLYIENVTQDKDIIFRVNDGGVTKTAIFVDASAAGRVGIGTATPGYGQIEIKPTDGDAATGLTLYAGSGQTARHWLGSSGEYHITRSASAALGITILGVSGYVGIGDPNPTYPLAVLCNTAGAYAAMFFNDGNNANRHGLRVQCGADDGSGVTYYLTARDGNGTTVGYLRNNSGTFELVDSSDESLKEDITDSPLDGLDVIKRARVRDFRWKRQHNLGDDRPKETGFIAQELRDVYPRAVAVSDDNLLGVAKSALIPPIVRAIQQLIDRVEVLEATPRRN